MSFLKYPVVLALLLLPADSSSAAIPVSPETCEDAVTERWLRLLENLKSLELDFFDRDRNLLKHWETIYNPLWQARIKKDDPYSINRKAEGELLYNRYSQTEEEFGALAEESDAAIKKRIKNMRQAIRELPDCCDGADYRICITPRREELKAQLDELEKFLAGRKTDEYEFTSRMRAALNDKPSDHDEFQDLHHDRLDKWSVESRVLFLQKMRGIREKLEVGWPVEKCCRNCTLAAQSIVNDLVLNRVRPDQQGNLGVQGKIVNNAGIKEAFDRYDAEQKKTR